MFNAVVAKPTFSGSCGEEKQFKTYLDKPRAMSLCWLDHEFWQVFIGRHSGEEMFKFLM